MSSRITKVEVSNFRSIKGSLTLDFDAPVVLIHGQNGSGKTSLLSAIELGMTGSISSLQRFDADYTEHLVHRGTEEACISVYSDHPEAKGSDNRMRITNKQVTGSPLLNKKLSRFYRERCALPQSTLGRLLEIYEKRDARDSDSPLTLFVKDLLGLDQLDALIDGLHHAGDIRRLRTALPVYADVEADIHRLTRELADNAIRVLQIDNQIAETKKQLDSLLKLLNIDPEQQLVKLVGAVRKDSEEPELQGLATLNRDMQSARTIWVQATGQLESESLGAVEKAHAQATSAQRRWEKESGDVLNEVLDGVRKHVEDLPPKSKVGIQALHEHAVSAVDVALKRYTARLEHDADTTKRQAEVREALEGSKTRASVLDEQLDAASADSGSMAEALASIAPYVSDSICPVCERDFTEVSIIPLQAHLSTHIAGLTEAASHLQALTAERTDASRTISQLERELAELADKELPEKRRQALKALRAMLQEFQQNLESLDESALEGQSLEFEVESLSVQLNDMRRQEQSAIGVRASVADYTRTLKIDGPDDAETTLDTLDRCLIALDEQTERLSTSQGRRRTAVELLDSLHDLTTRCKGNAEETQAARRQLIRNEEAKKAADAMRESAKRLSAKALRVRTNAVRRVFNESLNAVWRELFIRLAPDEPFVPAFALPERDTGPIEATLVTLYRDGGISGNPRAMLSAGNLNTAALTLFLSLHLSVKRTLPWLVIDDPVQSMDEVHIAQFAALLRTLSKEHDRQIIIAVHEKPLFDYLALELSPAFMDDRLITIELSRTADGTTNSVYNPRVWIPDTVFAA